MEHAGTWYRAWATIGFCVLVLVPVLAIAAIVVRGLAFAWQPRALYASLIEASGAAPRLAGWVAVLWLAALAIVWTMFQGTWLLAAWTAFKPLPVAFAQAIFAVVTALLCVAGSRPCARLFAFLAQKLDDKLPGRGTILQPPLIIGGAIVMTLVVAAALWELLVIERLKSVDAKLVVAPGVGCAVAGIVHAAWRVPPRVRLVGATAIATAAAVAAGVAVHCAMTRPRTTLAIWADAPTARLAIERAFDVEAIRRTIPLDRFAPPPLPGAGHPDIVLVTLSGARADRTPLLGGSAQMPALR
jgi:hypothetical protein